jgi:hypothetical protein
VLRVAEIVLGSSIGVAATLLIFPARARRAAVAKAAVVLGQLESLFGLYAEAVASAEPAPDTHALNADIRASLASLEAVMAEAAREARAFLGPNGPPDSLPRTLWRVRNDAVVIGRSLSRPFSPAIREVLATPAAGLLEAVRAELRALASALAEERRAPPSPVPAAAQAFREAFAVLRSQGVMRGLEFEEIGHVFGLAWAFDGMEHNLADLADRVDETASGRPEGRRAAEAQTAF